MGTIIQAECECGYKSKLIYAGRGMFGTGCTVPALCRNCNEIVAVKYLPPDAQCPNCGKEVIFNNDVSLRQEREDVNNTEIQIIDIFNWRIGENKFFRLPDTFYLCPKCKKMTMRFMYAGNWD